MTCHNCNRDFSDDLAKCPHCGAEARASASGVSGVRQVRLNLSERFALDADEEREEQNLEEAVPRDVDITQEVSRDAVVEEHSELDVEEHLSDLAEETVKNAEGNRFASARRLKPLAMPLSPGKNEEENLSPAVNEEEAEEIEAIEDSEDIEDIEAVSEVEEDADTLEETEENAVYDMRSYEGGFVTTLSALAIVVIGALSNAWSFLARNLLVLGRHFAVFMRKVFAWLKVTFRNTARWTKKNSALAKEKLKTRYQTYLAQKEEAKEQKRLEEEREEAAKAQAAEEAALQAKMAEETQREAYADDDYSYHAQEQKEASKFSNAKVKPSTKAKPVSRYDSYEDSYAANAEDDLDTREDLDKTIRYEDFGDLVEAGERNDRYEQNRAYYAEDADNQFDQEAFNHEEEARRAAREEEELERFRRFRSEAKAREEQKRKEREEREESLLQAQKRMGTKAYYQSNPGPQAVEEIEEIEEEEEERTPGLLERIYYWFAVRVRPIHFLIVIAVIAVILALPFLRSLGGPTRAFDQALASRDYDRAASIFEDRYSGRENLEEASLESFRSHLIELKQNAISGGTSYTATNAALNQIRSSGLYIEPYKSLMDETSAELQTLQEADILYSTANEKYNRSDFRAAILDFNRVQEIAPAYRDTVNLLSRSREKYREEVVGRVTSLQSQHNFDEALTQIDQALELLENDPILSNLRENTLTQAESALYETTRERANHYFESGNIVGVFETINGALAQEPEDASLIALKESYETRAAEQILNVSDELFLNDDKEAAVAKIEEGLEVMPENQLLLDALDRYDLESDESETTETDPETGETVKKPSTPSETAIVQRHTFTGDTSVIDRITIENPEEHGRAVGSISFGDIDAYTQIYYQIYAVDYPNQALRYGTFSANPGSDASWDLDFEIYGSDLIVNLNYLNGKEIEVFIDLELRD